MPALPLSGRLGAGAASQVAHIGRDDDAPRGDLVADELGRDVFANGDAHHLGCHDALACILQLSHRRFSIRFRDRDLEDRVRLRVRSARIRRIDRARSRMAIAA